MYLRSRGSPAEPADEISSVRTLCARELDVGNRLALDKRSILLGVPPVLGPK